MYSPVEKYIQEFHDQFPGGTSASFAGVEVVCEGKKFASSYDYLVSQVSAVEQAHRLLDIGCGDGYLLARLSECQGHKHSYAGIDFSSSELKLAAGHLGGNALLCCGNAQTLPFSSSSFDFVLSHMAFMLMPKIEEVFEEIVRVLKPSGKLLAVVGGAGPVSEVQEIFIEVLKNYPRDDKYLNVRFSGLGFKNAESIRSSLSSYLILDSVKVLKIELNRSPAGMWDWFEKMYDIKLLGAEAQKDAEASFLRLAGKLADFNGKLKHNLHIYGLSAKAPSVRRYQ